MFAFFKSFFEFCTATKLFTKRNKFLIFAFKRQKPIAFCARPLPSDERGFVLVKSKFLLLRFKMQFFLIETICQELL